MNASTLLGLARLAGVSNIIAYDRCQTRRPEVYSIGKVIVVSKGQVQRDIACIG